MHLVCEKTTNIRYAVKVIPRKVTMTNTKLIQREFLILQQMQHRNVVSFLYPLMHK